MTSVRVFFVGGLMSFRALFNWMNPWIFVPTILLGPITQILLFAYIGRAAGVGDDEFFIIGNALNYAAIPGMFAMTFTIGGERFAQTLGLVLVSPARRVPLFMGRALPVILTGWGTAMIGILSGVWVLDADIAAGAWPLVGLVVAVGAFATAGIGLVMGAINLVWRDGATLGNVVFLVLLVFTGTNVALEDLPAWMEPVGRCLPLTHAIEATRMLADGAAWGAVSSLVALELLIGAVYVVLGLVALRWLEDMSRRHATLDRV
ncbi:ABC transporter permease [Nocardioides eburneiflavus]|uniref:ABC transporter permease n=1 Tax=Nocardioides eburneiflavus TaxID=2518372 RepID=A0A4Z1CJF6_9ACTN|nr:ABC transporter permease [Nocardioides eburneiflavus]TGN63963.1 ABC transporter permease [Nocardioides eburneiflavus]